MSLQKNEGRINSQLAQFFHFPLRDKHCEHTREHGAITSSEDFYVFMTVQLFDVRSRRERGEVG